MDEETRRYVEEWKDELNRADGYIRYYLTLRVSALSFTIVGIGALLAFGWNYGFQYLFECTSFYQKLLRIGVIFLMSVFGSAYLLIEFEFRRRYDISGQEARNYEVAMGRLDGLHSKMREFLSPLYLIYPKFFIRLLVRYTLLRHLFAPTLRGVVMFLVVGHAVIMYGLAIAEGYNWYIHVTHPTQCKDAIVDKEEKQVYIIKQHPRSFERRHHVPKTRRQ